jgi:hypothetical protein
MEENKQVGCSLGILDKFAEVGTTITDRVVGDSTFKVFRGVCQFRRPEDWDGDLYIETFISTSIVVLHRSNDLSLLKASIAGIDNLTTPKRPKIIVCYTSQSPRQIEEVIGDRKDITKIFMIESLYDNAIYDEAFKRCKNGWVFFIESGKVLPEDTLEILNWSVTSELGKFVATSGIESYMAVVYKYFRGQMGASFVTKLQDMDPISVIDWSEIYENYRLLH